MSYTQMLILLDIIKRYGSSLQDIRPSMHAAAESNSKWQYFQLCCSFYEGRTVEIFIITKIILMYLVKFESNEGFELFLNQFWGTERYTAVMEKRFFVSLLSIFLHLALVAFPFYMMR